MKKFKALIFDYDGTLKTHHQSRISPSVAEKLRNWKKDGFQILLATGRPHKHCSYLLEENLIDCLISSNGSLVKNTQKTIWSQTISPKTVADLLYFSRAYELPCTIYAEDLFYNGIIQSSLITGLKDSMNLTTKDLSVYSPQNIDPVSLVCFFATAEIDPLIQQNFPNLDSSRWHSQIISIFERSFSKMTGIKEALKEFDIHPTECIAIGDGANDFEMLENAGFGIAVGGIDSPLNSVADLVVSNDKLIELDFTTLTTSDNKIDSNCVTLIH